MAGVDASGPRPSLRLSRALLLDACVRIADAEGIDAVTMRRLGADLGVDPTAVYRHFRDKGELLAATADRLLIDALKDVGLTGAWKDDLRALAIRIRAVYLSHPGLAQLVATASGPLPNEARLSDAALGILRSAGFTDPEAVEAFEVVEAYTLAVSNVDSLAAADRSAPWRRTYAALPTDDYPHLSAVAALLYRDPEGRFERGLDLLLDAIERDHRRASGT